MIETGLRVHSACWDEVGAWTWCVANQIEPQERGWAGWALDGSKVHRPGIELISSASSNARRVAAARARLLGPGPAPELLAPADEEAPAALSAAACGGPLGFIVAGQDVP
jgi:hypothetical protein